MGSSRLVPCAQITVLVLASPKLALQLYFVCCEGEGNLQLSSFPDMFQNRGVWGTAVRRARCGHEWSVSVFCSLRACPVRGGA